LWHAQNEEKVAHKGQWPRAGNAAELSKGGSAPPLNMRREST
jgi:hypothetical protein